MNWNSPAACARKIPTADEPHHLSTCLLHFIVRYNSACILRSSRGIKNGFVSKRMQRRSRTPLGRMERTKRDLLARKFLPFLGRMSRGIQFRLAAIAFAWSTDINFSSGARSRELEMASDERNKKLRRGRADNPLRGNEFIRNSILINAFFSRKSATNSKPALRCATRSN